MRVAVFGLVALMSAPAFGQILFDNGGIATPGSTANLCVPAGSVMSEVQAPNLNAGYNTIASTFHEADNFIVPAGQNWNVTGFRFAMYQTGATTATINQVFIQIWNGQPGTTGAAVIAGDLVTNRFASNSLTNTYRIFTGACATNRRVQDVRANLAANLGPGTYWVQLATNGSTAFTGPWWAPVTIEGNPAPPGANALTLTVATNTWAPVLDGANPQDFSFQVEGTSGQPCYPDCNQSTTLTIADFACFQAAFANSLPYADCNNSGTFTIADFACFQAAFANGCP